MKTRKQIFGFTLIELLIVIAIIALLMGILVPALTKVRRQGKRAVCLAHTRQLQIAWQTYAENNDGKPVNGGQAPPPNTATGYVRTERYWCTGFPTAAIPNYDWAWNTSNALGMPVLTYEQRIEKMKEGALWPYLKDIKIYHCTEAKKEMHRTFSIVESMNSHWTYPGGWGLGEEGKVVTNLGQIKKPSERIVFVEEGQPSTDAFMVIHDVIGGGWQWIDKPQAPHVKGANFSFVDGHAGFRKWEDKRTLLWASVDWTDAGLVLSPTEESQPNNKDLVWMIIATWGDIKNYNGPMP